LRTSFRIPRDADRYVQLIPAERARDAHRQLLRLREQLLRLREVVAAYGVSGGVAALGGLPRIASRRPSI